ncbi:hypothetical protein QCA50_016338 [Cerrena zonata]|uniref:Uncharacterized protein n=1 Tax=Cerrena zonata TaxID=2478898 RepID=A0AAW0FIX6_9APHY
MQVKFVVISSMLLAASGTVQGAPIPRDLGSDVSRIVQDVQRIANDVASVANGVIADLPPFLQTPASSIFNEVTAGAAKGFAEVTGILGDFVTLAPPTATPSASFSVPTTTGGIPVVNGGIQSSSIGAAAATQSAAFTLPGTPLSVSNPLASLFGLPDFAPTGTASGFTSTATFAPSDLAALLKQLMTQNSNSAGFRSGASISVSIGSPTASASSTPAQSTSSTSISSTTTSTSASSASSTSSDTPASSTAPSTVTQAPAISGATLTTIVAPVTLPGQPVTAVSSAASGNVYPNVPSKRGLGSLIGIIGSELGPLLQEADQLGNRVASIGNKVIAALPSDIQAPASSFFAEATAEVGKGFGFVTSIAGPLAAAAPTSTPTPTSTSAGSSGTPAPQNTASQSNGAMSISQMTGSSIAVVASVALGALVLV